MIDVRLNYPELFVIVSALKELHAERVGERMMVNDLITKMLNAKEESEK